LLASWDGDGKGLVANCFADFSKELVVGLDFGDFVLVGDLFVGLTVATGVFPVDICLCEYISGCSIIQEYCLPTPSNPLASSIAATFFA
jgi:hypothetical protein